MLTNIEKNKKQKIILIIILMMVIVGGVIGMYFTGVFNSKLLENEVKKETENIVLCFMNKDPQDVDITETKDGPMVDYKVLKLEFIHETNKIKGIYNIVPFASIATRGTFTGLLENYILITEYTYKQGEEESIKTQNFKLEEQGIWVEEGYIPEFKTLLKKIDCADIEFKQNIKLFR